MKKKIFLALLSIIAGISGIIGISAFEAHIVGVSAKIENALAVSPVEIDFGTVFPQEKFDVPMEIRLSESFLEEDRVDDIKYVIKQKPRCYKENEGYGSVIEKTNVDGSVVFACKDDTFSLVPALCPYLSKHKANDEDENDTEMDAFHGSVSWNVSDTESTKVEGYLTKLGNDIEDSWIIDLEVPCFKGQCAQDWTHQGWELDPALEHEIFGCDLWVEVTGISEQPVCGNDKIENTEQCDNGELNGQVCDPDYGSSCSYCSTSCELTEINGSYCGDGIVNGNEECDGGNECANNCAIEIVQNFVFPDTSPITVQQGQQFSFALSIENGEYINSLNNVVLNFDPNEFQCSNIVQAGDFLTESGTVMAFPVTLPGNGTLEVSATRFKFPPVGVSGSGEMLVFNCTLIGSNGGNIVFSTPPAGALSIHDGIPPDPEFITGSGWSPLVINPLP